MNLLSRLLEKRSVYNLVQTLMGFGGAQQVRHLFTVILDAEYYQSVLELGCGTGRWSVKNYEKYVRTDINEAYFPSEAAPGMEFRKIDATDLSSFLDRSFDLVYSIGLYHHLPDGAVVTSLRESSRVLRQPGKIVVMDAILPTCLYNVPAWVIRKMDRGDWVRKEERVVELIEQSGLSVRRQARCRWGPGLEGCFFDCVPEGWRAATVVKAQRNP